MIKNVKDILKTRRDIIKAYKKSRFEKTPNLISFDEDEDGDEDGDDGENGDDREDGDEDEGKDEDGEDGDKKLPDWVGVPGKKFNEIKNTITNYKDIKLHTRLLNNKVLYLTNTYKLINRIDSLDSNEKKLDRETYKLYNIVKHESIDLVNTMDLKGETDSRIALTNIFNLIGEIFSAKKDMPKLETEEEAEKRKKTSSEYEKYRVEKRQEEAFNKNVKRIRLVRQESKSDSEL